MTPPRPAARRTPAARRFAAALLGFAAAPALAEEPDGARRPLLAPKPAARVRIAAPAIGMTRLVAAVEEPPAPESGKPDIGAGPTIFTGPRGRVASVRRVETVPKPRPLRDASEDDIPLIGTDEDGFEGVIAVADQPLPPASPDGYAGPADPADGLAVAGDGGPNDSEPEAPAAPARPADPLAVAADEAIAVTAARLLTGQSRETRSNTPWQIGHGVMALREKYEVIADGRRVNALEWLATGPTFKGEGWFERGRFGPHGHPYSGTMYDFEGHPNQILAFLSMSRLPEDFILRDGNGRPFTIGDWIETAQREVRVNPKEEVTWTLWAFSHYLDPDAQWVNARRERWSMERLVAEEVRSRTEAHACGGTHGLYALASARNAYLQSGRSLRGSWRMADEKVKRYARTARALQNPDGSLSHAYFKQRGHTNDVVARIGSSGHTLEFLMMALPQRDLSQPWVRAALGRVSSDLLAGRGEQIGGKAVGGMYHAVHALVLYRERTGDAATGVPLQTAEGDPRRVVR